MRTERINEVTYRDGLDDGRVLVKLNRKVVGFYMKPDGDTMYFFHDQGRQMERFTSHGQIDGFVRDNFAAA